ncbi:hypothetical protein B0H14DRAFT_3511154 [Mycena olivaceomarginata]|nr:hypothetical protein B0H14DRAFT_3511154 [Mycena olivaceomarginata]
MLSSSRPARQKSSKRLSRPELVVLRIHRAHHLAQGLHHTTNIAMEEETPHETVGLIRDAVSVLLKNMVVLRKASLKYGAIEGADAPRYFVPSEGTTLFGMAEHFVDLYGYHGDGSLFDRALMFDNLNTLFRAMVLDGEYLQCGVDFPNFKLLKVDLEQYGIYKFIKPQQITRVHAEDPRIIWHQFGDHLLRYNPKLGEAAQYTFPDPSQEYPFDQESWLLNLNLLIPLVESAHETRAVLQTELDYPAFDKHGQLLIPDFYSVEPQPQEGTFGIGTQREGIASDGYSVRVLGGETAGVGTA